MSDETPIPAASPLAGDFATFLAALRTFRRDFLVEGQDYGVVPGTSGKPSLLKPGAEKLAAWLRLRVAFESDHGTWVQAGSPPGLFCFIARLADPDGQVVGEGRGSAHVEEGRDKYSKKSRDEGKDRPWAPNVAVKFAEKRAMVDAILRVGCISDLFTQDTEDMEAQAAAAFAAAQARAGAVRSRPPILTPTAPGSTRTEVEDAAARAAGRPTSQPPAPTDPDDLDGTLGIADRPPPDAVALERARIGKGMTALGWGVAQQQSWLRTTFQVDAIPAIPAGKVPGAVAELTRLYQQRQAAQKAGTR